MKSNFTKHILSYSKSRQEKLVQDLKEFLKTGMSQSAAVAWIANQYDRRKHPTGVTPEYLLEQVEYALNAGSPAQ